MVVNVRGKNVKLPDFLVVGAAKSGTTTLYYCLIQHPQIFMPKGKEPRFFSFMERPPHYSIPDHPENKSIIWRFEDYVKLFQSTKDDQIIGEGSVGYLYTYEMTIKHIKSIYGGKYKDLKIIAILRNPVDRAFSQYLLQRRQGSIERESFEETFNPEFIKKGMNKARGYDYIGFGMYYNQIKAYLNEFPNVKVYLFEDLKNIRDLIKDIFKFLNVDHTIEVNTNIKANPSGIPKNKNLVKLLQKASSMKYILPPKLKVKLAGLRDCVLVKLIEKPEVPIATREKLINIFRADILNLQNLIGRDLSPWLEIHTKKR
ncbi:MAG: sulfotransferase domain-containing protein [Candidatus Brocadiaceae bacterium]|nr:sulfotransferase domain-containing protein [Candidatus Brocadiaceae bacterium]